MNVKKLTASLIGRRLSNRTVPNGTPMAQENNVLHFYYDAQNRPAIVIFNGTAYGYLYNLQGDVVALVDGTGTKVVEYT